jgi:DNA-binding GntR family transcriptional regulator
VKSVIDIFERRAHESAKDYVLRVLTDNIVNIRLEPGQKLNEPELCARLGVSRTPFREAELELHQRRLIEIHPKIGTYVSLIDAELVEEVRHLREVLEAEVARTACGKLAREDIDRLWENVTLWHMYIERAQEEKIFSLDKEFHRILYERSGFRYWYELEENVAPHFDRTTILSFRCRPAAAIYGDHVGLLRAIEKGDESEACRIARQHMQRYKENLSAILANFPQYYKS